MKINHPAGLIILPLLAASLLASCIIPDHNSGDRHSYRHSSHGDEYGIYRSLPASFSGNSYYYDGRYYTGGDYQSGSFNHMGRRYTSRYHYKGTYLYGGRYQSHASNQWTDPRHDTYRRGDYRR